MHHWHVRQPLSGETSFSTYMGVPTDVSDSLHDHLYHFSPPLLIGIFPLHQCKNLLPPSQVQGSSIAVIRIGNPCFRGKKLDQLESSAYVQNLLLWVRDSTHFQSHLVCPLIFNSSFTTFSTQVCFSFLVISYDVDILIKGAGGRRENFQIPWGHKIYMYDEALIKQKSWY